MRSSEGNYKKSRKILAVLSRNDGPTVPVRRLRRIEVQGGGKEDVVCVHFTDHSLSTPPAPLFIRGGRSKDLHFPRGTVKVERISGTTPLTVIAVCERLQTDATKATGVRSVRGSD